MKGIYQFNVTNHLDWVRSKVPYIYTEDVCGFMALNDKGYPIGAALFDNFLHSSAQMTLVIDNPAAIRLGLLDCAGDWFFNQLKKTQVYAMVAEHNYRSLRLCKRVGFKQALCIEDGYAKNIGMLVLKLHKSDFNLKPRRSLEVGSVSDE